MQAQNEQAETEVIRADKIVQEEIDQFEQTKLRDLKVCQKKKLLIKIHQIKIISLIYFSRNI